MRKPRGVSTCFRRADCYPNSALAQNGDRFRAARPLFLLTRVEIAPSRVAGTSSPGLRIGSAIANARIVSKANENSRLWCQARKTYQFVRFFVL
jgi:hypothetical protein